MSPRVCEPVFLATTAPSAAEGKHYSKAKPPGKEIVLTDLNNENFRYKKTFCVKAVHACLLR